MNIRYVVIDDAAFIAELVRTILRDTGAVFVGSALDGEEGLRLFQKTLPDLVILDMVMPKENGIEIARKIRGLSHDVVIIACSTLDDRSIMENAKDAGCDAYISKPFTKEGFLKVVKEKMRG